MSAPVNVAELRTYLGTDNSAEDPVLQDMLSRALNALESMTDRNLYARQEVREFHPEDDVQGPWLLLGDDLAEVVSVTNGDGTAWTQGVQYVTWPSRPPFWKLKAVGGYSWGWSTDPDLDRIQVDGYWGRTRNLEGESREAVIKLAAFLYRQRDNVSDADRPIVTPEGIVLMPARLPPEIQSFVKRRRKRRVMA